MTEEGYEIDPQHKRRLQWVAIGLTALLIALIVALVLMLREPRLELSDSYVEGIRPLKVLYGPGVGPEPLFDAPMGVAYGEDGMIYVADTGNNRIVVFDSDGTYLFQFGGFGVGKPAAGVKPTWRPGLFNYPTDVATGPDGTVYVADFRNDQIQVFTARGRFLRSFPDRNKQVGRGASGQEGTGIAVTSIYASDDRLYATDRYQVVVFDLTGRVIRQFGKPGVGADDLDHPNGVTIDVDSNVIVSDSNHNRVVAFTPEGRRMWSAGGPAGLDWDRKTSAIEIPRGVATLPDGRLLVADAMGSQLVVLSEKGREVVALGRRGAAPGELNFPTDVDAAGSRIVVAEKGNNRIQVIMLNKE